MPVFSELFFAFVGCNFSQLTLSSTGHVNLSLYMMKHSCSMPQGGKKVKGFVRTHCCEEAPALGMDKPHAAENSAEIKKFRVGVSALSGKLDGQTGLPSG
jgi:hypothetical protein